MPVDLELTIDFKSSGNSQSYLAGGWARAESDFTWMIGGESQILVRLDPEADAYLLLLDVIPFTHAPDLPSQRLIVSANNAVVGSCSVSRPSILAYKLPNPVFREGRRTVITLQHPDAARPIDISESPDDRSLALSIASARLYRLTADVFQSPVALPPGLMLPGTYTRDPGQPELEDISQYIKQQTGLTTTQLVMQFESLGENCEFGLVQRRCDAEPLGLLRFSSTFIRDLVRGLEAGFDGIGAPEDLEPRLEGMGAEKEYMIADRRYGLLYHTFVLEHQRSAWLLKEQESTRLKFLHRKFMEELEVHEKIFVYKQNAQVSREEVRALFLALNRYGSNTLLWVVPVEAPAQVGTVEVLENGLFRGYVDRFAPPENAHDLSLNAWLRVCLNAWRLMQLQSAAPGSGSGSQSPLPLREGDGGRGTAGGG
ncbi:MAG TPA: hypothetical protein VMB73_02750 [Acetobacteraceae bacterium]|nr:hypothetical protein [Acetobacteraceae bacterium]